jgi:hypothetical protein
LRVVDANGNEVGILAPPNAALVQIEGTWVQIALKGSSFDACSTASASCLMSVFEDATCGGPAYIAAGDGLVQTATIVDDVVRYPSGPVVATREINSLRVDGGQCYPMSGTWSSAEMKSAPAPNVTAPFHLSR